MNQRILKKIIKVKIDIASKIINHLPTKAASELKNIGKILKECLNEYHEEETENIIKQVNID